MDITGIIGKANFGFGLSYRFDYSQVRLTGHYDFSLR